MDPKQTRINLDRAIRFAGSAAELARCAGVGRATICKSRKNGRVSPDLSVRIERATSGRVHRSDFHPELWDIPQAQAEVNHAG